MSDNEWQMYDSSSIAAGRYDANTRVLEIQFNEGKIYRYLDVPQAIWLGLCRADSKGGYFQSQIRDRFRHEVKGGSSSAGEYGQPSVQRPPEAKPTPPPLPSTASGNYSATRGTAGSSLGNPFRTSSIPYAYTLLDSLSYRTRSGNFKVTYERTGSKKADGLPEPVDCYELYISRLESPEHSGKIMDFFIYSYSSNPHTIENLPEGLIFNGSVSRITSVNPEKESGKSYYDLAMSLGKDANGQLSDKKMRENVDIISALLHKSAELNYLDAQELLVVKYSRTNPKECEKWFRRAERTKQGLSSSAETDYKPSAVQGGGCASVIVIGLVTAASLYFI